VNRLTMLVTSDGQWVLEDDAAFLDALGDPAPDYDAVSFAVKNLGFIKFQLLDDSVIEIDLHPRNVELPALLAVQQQLLTSNVRLFRIKYFDTSWKSEIILSADLAVSRLSEMCAPAFAPPASSKFIGRAAGLQRAVQRFGKPLRPDGAEVADVVRSGITPSMSRKGDCLDNAPMESFFHTPSPDLPYPRRRPT
jgi:hypothetical protein